MFTGGLSTNTYKQKSVDKIVQSIHWLSTFNILLNKTISAGKIFKLNIFPRMIDMYNSGNTMNFLLRMTLCSLSHNNLMRCDLESLNNSVIHF